MATIDTPNRLGKSRTALPQVMRKHPLFSFFAMSYVFSWAVSIPYVLCSWNVLPGNYTPLFILKPFVGPTLAVLVMTAITEGREGLAHLRQRLRMRGTSLKWSLIILVVIPLLMLVGIIVQPQALASFQGIDARVFASYPVYFVVVFFGVALPEEVGWRGFALPRMQPRYGPLRGTLLLGVLWAFWHLFYFTTPDHGGGPGVGISTYVLNFSLFFLMVVALAIIFTWVFNHTQGSVFIANLLHAAIDTPQLVWIPFFAAVGETSLDLATLIVFGIAGILIVVLTRGQLGYATPEPGVA